MARLPRRSIGRRGFLKDAAAGAAALVAAPALAGGAQTPPQASCVPQRRRRRRAWSPPKPAPPPPRVEVYTTDRPGGDFMVDVLKSLDFEYVAANPGSSFRGLHESIINYGGNTTPEFITCCHEESSVAMAHGYFKVEGKPMLVHGARHRRPAARVDGDLQRLLRPRAGLHRARQHRSTRRCGAAASSGRTACRTRRRWCATSSSGTTRRSRCRTSPSRRCAPTRSR